MSRGFFQSDARIGAALATLVALATCACATAVRQPRSDMGIVTVGVTTSGEDSSTLRFRVSIEPAGISDMVKADAGVFERRDVPPGDHVVRLRDLPARCRVDGDGERAITISPQRRSAVLRFHVVCG